MYSTEFDQYEERGPGVMSMYCDNQSTDWRSSRSNEGGAEETGNLEVVRFYENM